MEHMRQFLTAMLIVAILAGGAATVNFPSFDRQRSQERQPSTGHVPNQAQMDRDFADVPRTQISSPAGTMALRVEIAPISAERHIAPSLTIGQPVAIIKQQHVFRI